MFNKDMSYVSNLDLQAIDKGLAELDVFSIRMHARPHNANRIEALTDKLASEYMIYQYKDKNISFSKDNWDLFFWCNNENGEHDYSYITLNFNKNRTVQQRLNDLESILDTIKITDCNQVNIYIQYTVTYSIEKTKERAINYLYLTANKYVEYMGKQGKIKPVGPEDSDTFHYGFFPKGAKRKYYKLDYIALVRLSLLSN